MESQTGLGWKGAPKSSISNLLPQPGIFLMFKDVLKPLLGLPLLLGSQFWFGMEGSSKIFDFQPAAMAKDIFDV